jgi:capsular exopolysaccharide synthesis family protein
MTKPVLEEIRQLHDERQTGILRLANQNGERVDLFVREGIIDAASSNLNAYRLGEYLKKDTRVLAEDLDLLGSKAHRPKILKRPRILIGQAVVQKGLLSQVEVGAAVRRQALELLEHVFKNGLSVDSFTNSLESYYAPARIGFPQVRLVACRCNAKPFEPEPQMRIVLSGDIDLSVFSWNTEEFCVLTELRYPNTFQGLLNRTGIVEANLKRIIGILDSLRIIKTLDVSDLIRPENIDHHSVPQDGAVVKTPEQGPEQLVPIVTNAFLNERLEVARNEFSFTSEQFKSLKVQIGEVGRDASLKVKVITVSSPDAGDGKSFVSVNLADSFARDPGRRVIIVDCDLRTPAVQRYLGVTQEPGLLQYVENPRLSPYCYMRRLENLYFLTAGGVAGNPIEILSMNAVKQLIECLRRDFDTVILDTPPYTPIADARIATTLSDGLILVLRRGKTTYTSTDRALSAIDRKKLLGVILNDVQPMPFHTFYNSDYYGSGRRSYVYRDRRRIEN